MCLAVYIGSNKKQTTSTWKQDETIFYFQELSKDEELIKAKFTKHYVYYVGSNTGCSCGFDWKAEFNNNPNEQNNKNSPQALIDFIATQTKKESIEFYCCWEGDWNEPIEEKIELDISDIGLEKNYFIKEKRFIVFKKQFQAIINELQNMVEVDQAMRNRCIDNPDEWDPTLDHQNTERIKIIIDEIGWPSISKVGKEGSSNAWLLVQHADHDLSFQKKCLELMKLEPEGEVSKRDIAYLEDRIAVAEERPQIYGTQFYKNSDEQLVPLPIMNEEEVDERRKNMGLETLNQLQKRIQEKYSKKIT